MSEFEKKTERIEIRVSHSKKQAFNSACENSGDTPSSALRRFIDGYINRADHDAFADGLRAMGRMTRRRWLPISAGVAALLLGGIFAFQASKPLQPATQDGPILTAATGDFPPINYALFAAYDENANGVLDLGEVADNDEHLHRLLNLDGEAGISPAEFYTQAKMQWKYIKKSSTEMGIDDAGLPTASSTIDGEPKIYRVGFDLENPEAPIIDVRNDVELPTLDLDLTQPLPDDLPDHVVEFLKTIPAGVQNLKVTTEMAPYGYNDRSVDWERGAISPALSFSNYAYRPREIDPAFVTLPDTHP